MSEGTTVLLGAGASYEAHVPMAVGMTDAVATCLRRVRSAHSDELAALDLVLAALSEKSVEPDIETVYSAIQMLGDLDNLEIRPFVDSWRMGIDAFSEKPVLYPGDQRWLEPSVFQKLEDSVVRALRDVIRQTQGSSTYLAPLLNLRRRPLNIVTLNYDTTIETMAANEDVPLTDGVEAWNGGVRWTWPRRWRGIRLLKLHGSVDWLLSSPTWPPGHPGDKARRMKVRGVVRAEPGDSPWEQPGRTSPALIFGRRGKLRSEGPYLAMLNEFRRILRNETGRLIIIGYSFRDEHVNDPIREWFNCTGKPRVICVDPSLAGDPSMVVSNADKYGFAATLFAALEDPTREGPLDFCVDSDRHALIAQGAGEALRALLG